ncbi:hypothetical protein BsWGS_01103 [Bradybaena similaris]
MSQWALSCAVLVLVGTFALFRVSHTEVFTSSKKIEDMVLQEEHILNKLHAAVRALGNDTAMSCFDSFYQERMPKARGRRHDTHLLGYLRHPNGIYHSIMQFATEYENIRSALKFARSSSIRKQLSFIATKEDITGARLSFLRLQDVYNFNTSTIIRGNYFGFPGPELGEADIFGIGEAAFNDNRWHYAVDWLQEGLAQSRKREPTVGFFNPDNTVSPTARTLAMIGRAYLRQGHIEKAADMHSKALSAAAEMDEHITALEQELKVHPLIPIPLVEDENVTRLCSLQNKWTQETFDRRLVCSYREAFLPYYRFKQELISVSPYVVLFFEVISDQEIDTFIDIAKTNLRRGTVEIEGSSSVDNVRTSDLSFLDDYESPILGRLSWRVAALTGLNAAPHECGKDFNAEPFQVVNYGMGGHYSLHHDFFYGDSLTNNAEHVFFKYGGNRMATFLMYLTDVEQGGSTIFSKVDLAVRPVKKMALFWYSYKPSGEQDMDTLHAACPVVVGHKWVSNKWMWQYGNTFTRRCGLTPEATQLDIEPYMRKGWA